MNILILLILWLLGLLQPMDVVKSLAAQQRVAGGQTPPVLCIGGDCSDGGRYVGKGSGGGICSSEYRDGRIRVRRPSPRRGH